MKKFALIIVALLMAFVCTAQDRTLATKTFAVDQTKYTYTGVTADTLTSFQDSIAMAFIVNKEYPCQIYILSELSPRAGADTTVTVYLQGRMFNTQSWTTITSASSSVTTDAENVVSTVAQASGTMSWDTVGNVYTFTGTFTNTSVMNFYREFRLIYKIAGNDHTGTGVKINSIAIKLWRREY